MENIFVLERGVGEVNLRGFPYGIREPFLFSLETRWTPLLPRYRLQKPSRSTARSRPLNESSSPSKTSWSTSSTLMKTSTPNTSCTRCWTTSPAFFLVNQFALDEDQYPKH